MAEQLQELLERINREGVEKAEKKAAEIIAAGEASARAIVAAAEKQARELEAAAATAAAELKENGQKAIEQSSRNVLLSLREEIRKIFDRILTSAIGEALTPEALTRAILDLIGKCGDQLADGGEVQVLINPQDAEKIAQDLLARFQKEAAGKLTVKPVPSVDAGFIISFDGGKSSYDFTDTGLRDLLSTYLSSQLKDIINR